MNGQRPGSSLWPWPNQHWTIAIPSPPHIRVYGAGPAGLFAAETLARGGAKVTIVDRMPSPARKLLMAGRGGLNLTHTQALEGFLGTYGQARTRLEPAIRAFPPEALRAWADDLGAETFAGSSGRVFPKAMKASPLLRAWLARLGTLGVELTTRETWSDFSEGPAVLAFGGASWPRLGSDGSWSAAFVRHGLALTAFGPSNAGIAIAWTEGFKQRFAGRPLKGVALSFGGQTMRGEVMITADGLEGGAAYALSPLVRQAAGGALTIDLVPHLGEEDVSTRLSGARKKDSASNRLRKALRLSPAAIALLREGTGSPKALTLQSTGVGGLARAISSSGGVHWDEVDEHFMLKKKPGIFLAGEMLDWEAPTGGYLLQACFATGRAAALGCLRWLAPPGP